MYKYFTILLCFIAFNCEAKLPEIGPRDVTIKGNEIMKAHASHKELTPTLVQRALNNTIENLDYNKTYFIESDIDEWIHPSNALLENVIEDFNNSRFPAFEKIQNRFIKAIERRRLLEQKIDYQNLPTNVKSEEFKEMPWAKSEEELINRLKRIRALQIETAAKLSDGKREKSKQKIEKWQSKYEGRMMSANPLKYQRSIFSQGPLALASSPDPHSGEAAKFMTNVQLSLFGIELVNRLRGIQELQIESEPKPPGDDLLEKSMQRIAKRQSKYEDDMMVADPQEYQRLISSQVLKSIASSLDAHSVYFTPGEAAQFMINVQQRLFGIGAQLRDDINGFTVMKIVEGGPAANGKQLKEKDRIIAVNGEPVVGMDIIDAVELIRGKADSPVILTVIRDVKKENGEHQEEKLDLTIFRGEVVLKESRFKSSYEPFGEGIIGYLKLYSFYQDPDSSSAQDLKKEIEKLKNEHRLEGLILDLRYNSGGLLTQAVDVTGLFITKGIVVSIKDENGRVQHLRILENEQAWNGPLIVLVNRMSASASEIVSQTLQDYGRAIVVGDDHTFGKGSYQTFTLATDEAENVNPQGEYKVTRGRYYTVSGKTPQLTGVFSDILIPGPLSESEIGERFSKYPLENDQIKSNFSDDLSDISFLKRDQIRQFYKFDLQEKLETFTPYLALLKKNSQSRLEKNLNFQNLIKEIKKKEKRDPDHSENFGQNDLQLEESYNIMKDLIVTMNERGIFFPSRNKEAFSLINAKKPLSIN